MGKNTHGAHKPLFYYRRKVNLIKSTIVIFINVYPTQCSNYQYKCVQCSPMHINMLQYIVLQCLICIPKQFNSRHKLAHIM